MSKETQEQKVSPWAVTTLILLAVLPLTFLFQVQLRPRKAPFSFLDIRRAGSEGREEGKGSGVGEVDLSQLTPEELKAAKAFLKFKKIKGEVIPSGVPEVYGEELGVNFDQVQESMNKMRVFGPDYGEEGKKIALSGKEQERYQQIGEQTSCQYCCGVKTLVKEDGSAACGCAHSIVMRALTAYLIQNHSDSFSDEEILAEVNRWKKAFFPKQTLAARFEQLKEEGDQSVENLLEEFPAFLPNMVGGC